jgi:hypothetical protein
MREIMMKATLAAFATTAILATTLGAGVAEAREWEASGGYAIHVLASPGLDAAATSDVISFGELSAGVEVLRDLPLVDRLVVEARWQEGSTSASDFDLYDASMTFDELELGVRAVRLLVPHVRGFVHGDLGGVHGALAIHGLGASGGGLSDSDWALSGYVGAGLDLAAYQQQAEDPHPDFAFGLRLELGYQVTGALSFAGHADTPDAVGAPLDTRAAGLGDLDAGGAVVQIAAFGRW